MSTHALQRLPFFVYGTLIPGQPNDYLWQEAIYSMEAAFFRNGKLYDMGFYPMLVEGDTGTVKGRLITVAHGGYQQILKRIDALEGYQPQRPGASAYKRLKREVSIANGQRVQAWTYVGRSRVARRGTLISGGDWVAYAARRNKEISGWWTTVTTVSGLHDD